MTAEALPARPQRREVDGIVLLDKPLGLSSNRALQRVKSLFNARKAGHSGSLDPLATGMLPICLGEATKMAGYLLAADKLYRVRLAFGLSTATGDAEGFTTGRGAETVPREVLEVAMGALRGSSLQTPPMYSALKVGGQPLYRLARAGQEVEREARPITIHDLRIEAYDEHAPVLRIQCSKGTYVRTLVEDLAAYAGTVAHVVELRRLAVAPFDEGSMVTLAGLEAAAAGPSGALEAFLIPADQAMLWIPSVQLEAAEAARIAQGQLVGPVESAVALAAGVVRLYGDGGRFLGIGERLADGRLAPRRLVRQAVNPGHA